MFFKHFLMGRTVEPSAVLEEDWGIMQFWMEITAVSLHKITKTMPRRMRAVTKAKT